MSFLKSVNTGIHLTICEKNIKNMLSIKHQSHLAYIQSVQSIIFHHLIHDSNKSKNQQPKGSSNLPNIKVQLETKGGGNQQPSIRQNSIGQWGEGEQEHQGSLPPTLLELEKYQGRNGKESVSDTVSNTDTLVAGSISVFFRHTLSRAFINEVPRDESNIIPQQSTNHQCCMLKATNRKQQLSANEGTDQLQ